MGFNKTIKSMLENNNKTPTNNYFRFLETKSPINNNRNNNAVYGAYSYPNLKNLTQIKLPKL